jgi:hypothetical protein
MPTVRSANTGIGSIHEITPSPKGYATIECSCGMKAWIQPEEYEEVTDEG